MDTADPPAKRRLFRRFGLCLAALILVGAATAMAAVLHVNRPQRFVRHWSEEFRPINTLEAARGFAKQHHPVIVHELPSGEWLIATCEHGCCSGAGFNATVIRDSTGATQIDTRRCYCGIHDLEFTLDASEAHTLKDLYVELDKER